MKNLKIYFLSAFVILLSACGGTEQENQETAVIEEPTEIRESWRVSTVNGTITELDAETRKITLMGSEGNLVTVTASDEIERFNEFMVGDIISYDFVEYLMAEFRAPTAEELETPLVIVADAAKAPADIAPAGAVGAVVKAVVSIEVLNRPFMLATVKGPQGNYLTLPVKDAAFMKELHIGQVFILTYAEAKAISLIKL